MQKSPHAVCASARGISYIDITVSATVQIPPVRSCRSHSSLFPSALPYSKRRMPPAKFSLRGSMRSGVCIRGDKFSAARPARGFAHTAAIFCTAVNGERKIFTAVFAGAHRNPLPDALAQRKVDQVVHILWI